MLDMETEKVIGLEDSLNSSPTVSIVILQIYV